jgi:hypothetical protein
MSEVTLDRAELVAIAGNESADPVVRLECAKAVIWWDSVTPKPLSINFDFGSEAANEAAKRAASVDSFYVTIKRDSLTGYLVGPFDTKEDAEPWVKIARDYAEKYVDAFTVFDAFGITKRSKSTRPGTLNSRLGISAATL